jgi:lysophospholipase L1-like esterase
MMRRSLVCAALGAIVATAASGQAARAKDGHWVAIWAAAPQQPLDSKALHFAPGQTIRLIVRTTLGGGILRIRISNLYGETPLRIGGAHVALRAALADIDPASDRALRFGGQESILIPPHESVLSDPVALDLQPESDLAISLYLPDGAIASTMHALARQTNFASAQIGDMTAAAHFPVGTTFRSWPFLAAVELNSKAPAATIVAFGDSLIDGDGSTVDANQRWPNLLAHRLLASGRPLSVVNEGVIANRLLEGVAPEMRNQFGGLPGDSGIDRFRRDVLTQAGVRCVVVRIGTNDIGFPGSATPASQQVSADMLLKGYLRLEALARRQGLKTIIATIPPFEGAKVGPGYYSEAKERVRGEVNERIRSDRAFDAVVDFDRVLRDPSHPSRLNSDYDSGDHLHPNDAGYRALAEATPLSLFWPRCASAAHGRKR